MNTILKEICHEIAVVKMCNNIQQENRMKINTTVLE